MLARVAARSRIWAAAAGAALALALAGGVASASSLGPVQWAFTGLGAPSASRAGLTSSWFRGNGTWNAGSAKGTIYADDSRGSTAQGRVTLSASGSSALSPGITKGGMKGVGLVIPVTVTATKDHACAKGTKGTVTLFASYYSVHVDTLAAHFASACSDHDLTFTGSVLKVEIQRNGAQVNST
jgi:hypothetical protein